MLTCREIRNRAASMRENVFDVRGAPKGIAVVQLRNALAGSVTFRF